MEREFQQRIARNESIFRDVNEAIERGHWPGEEDSRLAFRCECGRLGCSRMIEITVSEYEHVRADPRRFLVALDHRYPDVETILERHESYVVVQKRDQAGRVAESTDPRA